MRILIEWASILLMFFGGAILYDATKENNKTEPRFGKLGAGMLITGIILVFVWLSMYSNS